MLEFQIFRLKIFPSRQRNLFEEDLERTQILSSVIKSLPEVELKEGSIWHIGDIIDIEEGSLYFRLGRTTSSTYEMYKDGHFLDESFEVTPYTHVLIDINLEFTAIAKKPRLSPNSKGIANALTRLLNESKEGIRLNATFEISEISDPEKFIEYLNSAYSVQKFWISFSRPNPIDVNRDYIQPMQNLLKESNGDEGKTEIKGTVLRPEILQEVARSAAVTGDNAGATMIIDQKGQKITKTLRENPIIIMQEEVDKLEDKMLLLQKMRNIYEKIRGRD